jgi:hypothetical protein
LASVLLSKVLTHTVDGYNSGVAVKLPGISCNGNKVQVHRLDIVEGKISNDDVSVLRDTGCSTVFAHSKFTNTDHLTGHARDICLADGTVKPYLQQYQVYALVLYCHYTRYLVILQLHHYYSHQQYVHAEFVYISQTYLVYVHSLLASLALQDNRCNMSCFLTNKTNSSLCLVFFVLKTLTWMFWLVWFTYMFILVSLLKRFCFFNQLINSFVRTRRDRL